MIVKAEGLVLKCFPYSDTSLITKIFTRQHGLLSFIVPGGRNSKNKMGNLLQTTHLIEFEMYWREQKNFQKLKDCRVLTIYTGLFNDFSRKAIALFICEVLTALLDEKEENEELFNFVKYSLQDLDEAENIPSIYPSVFMLSLSNVLGFYPSVESIDMGLYFDVENGSFTGEGLHTLPAQTSNSMKHLLESHSQGLAYPTLDQQQRTDLLHALIEYFRWHISGFRQVRSPELLHILLA